MPTAIEGRELLVIQVPASVKQRLRDLRWSERQPVSVLVRKAIDKFLTEHEPAK